jgi:predicted nucleotidyltransferase component of viral defense system
MIGDKMNVIDRKTKEVLIKLEKKFELRNSIYLAGGTGLALQIGHRKSYDLDFFTNKEFEVNEVIDFLKDNFDTQLEMSDKRTIKAEIDGVRFSLFYYDYPLLSKFERFGKINLASIKDIAAMKLVAITNRGAKRDFIDIYFISKMEGLEKLLEYYEKKYKKVKPNIYNVLKGLVYFDDAEDEPMPRMIKTVSWDEVKEYFRDEVKKIVCKRLEVRGEKVRSEKMR